MGVIKDLQKLLIAAHVLSDPLCMNGGRVSEDGNVGSSTIKGLQTFLNNNWEHAGGSSSKLWRNGSFGTKTVTALTNYLKAKEEKTEEDELIGELEDKKCVGVTGRMDMATVKAIQAYMNGLELREEELEVDGDWSFKTIIRFQIFLNRNGGGVSEDGNWGSRTKKATQKLLNNDWGAASFQKGTLWVDGSFGEKSVKALQTYINSKRAKWGDIE